MGKMSVGNPAAREDRFLSGSKTRETSGTKRIRVSVDLDPDTHRKLRVRAAEEGCSMGALLARWGEEKLG